MESWIIAVVGAVVLLTVVGIAVMIDRRRQALANREAAVRDDFGAEYDRTRDNDGRRDALAELETEAERLRDLDLDRVGPDDRAALTERWVAIKARFVDAPADAIRQADELVTDVMRRRNLPVGTVEERVRALAFVDSGDGDVAVRFRDAHQLFVALESDAADDREAADFREALLVYQEAFEIAIDRPLSEQDERVDTAPTEPVRRG